MERASTLLLKMAVFLLARSRRFAFLPIRITLFNPKPL